MGQCIEMRLARHPAHGEFHEFLRVVAIIATDRAIFDADPIAWLWDANDADQMLEKAWLDAEAPGWSVDVIRGQHHELDMDGDAVGYLDYQVTLVFAAAAHQDAWHARKAAIEAAELQFYFRIAERRASAPAGVEVCLDCGGYMHATDHVATRRVGQFAFTCRGPALVCDECGCEEFAGPNADEMDAACSMAALRVGLPSAGAALWTAALGEEWERRSAAAPEIEIAVSAEMSAEAMIASLDDALAARGRVFGWRPRLVAA